MKLGALFSGGKDSIMALYRAIQEHEIPVLISMIPERDDSYMYHVPNIGLTEYSAKAIGIPLFVKKTSGVPPQEVIDLKNAVSEVMEEYGIDGVVVGAVRSNYQYKRVAEICGALGIKLYAPYWQESHEDMLMEALSDGFEIMVVAVAAYGMNESWLGRMLDLETLEELRELNTKYGVDIGGEGGEYETLVLDGPIFRKRLNVVKSKKYWHNTRGEMIIEELEIVDK